MSPRSTRPRAAAVGAVVVWIDQSLHDQKVTLTVHNRRSITQLPIMVPLPVSRKS